MKCLEKADIIYRDRKYISCFSAVVDKVVTTKKHVASFWGDGNPLKLTVMMAA